MPSYPCPCRTPETNAAPSSSVRFISSASCHTHRASRSAAFRPRGGSASSRSGPGERLGCRKPFSSVACLHNPSRTRDLHKISSILPRRSWFAGCRAGSDSRTSSIRLSRTHCMPDPCGINVHPTTANGSESRRSTRHSRISGSNVCPTVVSRARRIRQQESRVRRSSAGP